MWYFFYFLLPPFVFTTKRIIVITVTVQAADNNCTGCSLKGIVRYPFQRMADTKVNTYIINENICTPFIFIIFLKIKFFYF